MNLAIKRLLSYLPTNLPVGMAEFQEFSDSILELSGQYADADSMRFAIASMIIHLPAGKGSATKNFFVRSLRKSAANQIASQVFQDIKAKQQEAAKAALAVDTANTTDKAASNGSRKTEENSN